MAPDYRDGITHLNLDMICSCLQALSNSGQLTNQDWFTSHNLNCEMLNAINTRKEDTRYFYKAQRIGIHPKPLPYPTEYLPFIEAEIRHCRQQEQKSTKRMNACIKQQKPIQPADFWITLDRGEQLKILEECRYFETFKELITSAQKTSLLKRYGLFTELVVEQNDAPRFVGMTATEIQKQRQRDLAAHRVGQSYELEDLEAYFYYWLRNEKKVDFENSATVKTFLSSTSLSELLAYREAKIKENQRENEVQQKALNEAWGAIDSYDNTKDGYKNTSENSKTGKLTYVAIKLFCGMIAESGIIPRQEMEAGSYCKLVCQKYRLPKSETLRQYFTTNPSFKEGNKHLRNIVDNILPTMEADERKTIENYIENKIAKNVAKLYG